MALDADALHASFGLAIERQPNLTAVFYEQLFARHPEARPLFFRRPLEVQERMLAETLVAALDHLDDGAWLSEKLAELGRRHAEYGVGGEMYGWVAEALLATLETAAGDGWTAAYTAAWRDALGAITDLMMAGYPERQALA